jgi:hypothetical protein
MGDFWGGADAATNSFLAAFNAVDSAFDRRRQRGQQDRALDQQAARDAERKRQWNQDFGMRQTQDARAAELHGVAMDQEAERKRAAAVQEAIGRAVAEYDTNGRLTPEARANLANLVGGVESSPFDGNLIDTGNGFAPTVSGRRPDGSTFQGMPATHDGVPVAQGGKPITFGSEQEYDQYLMNAAAGIAPAGATYLMGKREQGKDEAAFIDYARNLGYQGGGAGGAGGQGQPAQDLATRATSPTGLLSDLEADPFAPGFTTYNEVGVSELSNYVSGGEVPGPARTIEERRPQYGLKYRVPAHFKTREQWAAEGLTPTQVSAKLTEQKAWIEENMDRGSQNQANRRGAQAEAVGKNTSEYWGAMTDPTNPKGDEARALLETEPRTQISRYRSERNNITSKPARVAADEMMYPAVTQQLNATRERYAQFEPEELESPEAKATLREMRRYASMRDAMFNDYDPAQARKIFGDRIPIGNENLAGRVADSLENAPYSPTAITPRSVDAAVANIQRNNNTGKRTLATSTLRSLHRLVSAGVIDGEQATNYILSGALELPKLHNLGGGALYQQLPTGEVVAAVLPDRSLLTAEALTAAAQDQRAAAERARKLMGEGEERLKGVFDSTFAHYEEPDRERMWADLLVQMGRGGPQLMQQYGIDAMAMGNMSQAELAQIVGRYRSYRDAAEHAGRPRWWMTEFAEQRDRQDFLEENTMYSFEGEGENQGQYGGGLPINASERISAIMAHPERDQILEDARVELQGPPYNMSWEEVKNLQPEQIIEMYLREETGVTRAN